MICRFHQLHKMLLHHICIFTGQCTLHIGIDNTLCSDFLTNIVINQLGIILGTDTGQWLSLCFRNTQTLKCILNIFRHIGPFGFHLRIRSDISNNLIHIQAFYRWPPIRHCHLIVNLKRMQTKKFHPFLFGQFLHNFRRQSCFNPVCVFFIIFKIIYASIYIFNLTLFFHRQSLLSHAAFTAPEFHNFRIRFHWSLQQGMHLQSW